ncbi:MAG TPA: signal peptidase II, partial [Niabella sp.]|nr:signal peptidase II [Niabella sp.]
PRVSTHYPSWFPFVGGDPFEFFAPVFNIADAAISTGVITLLVFQKKFYKKEKVSVTEVVKDEMEKAAK